MVTQVMKEKSEQIRSFIIDLGSKQTITMMLIAERYGIDKKLINHHLRVLLREGFLVKHKKHEQVNGSWACGYNTIKNEPYVWDMVKAKKVVVMPTTPMGYDDGLMFRMGYTNIIPEGGRLCLGVMSKG